MKCPEGSYAEEKTITCESCDSTCKTCRGPAFTDCLSFKTIGNKNYFFYNFQCLEICPKNYFTHEESWTCIQSCPYQYYGIQETKKCEKVKSCANTQFLDETTRICTPCSSNCLTCFGTAPSNCLSCPTDLYIFPPDNFFTNTQLRQYYKRYFNIVDVLSFPRACKSSNMQISCTSCKENGRGKNNDIQICQPCKANCLICKDGFLCLKCKENFYVNPITDECSNQSFADISLGYFSSTSTTLFILTLDSDWPVFTNYLLSNKKKSIESVSFSPLLSTNGFKYIFAESQVPNSVLINFTFFKNFSRGTIMEITFNNPPAYDSVYTLRKKTVQLTLRGFRICQKKGYGYSIGMLYFLWQ